MQLENPASLEELNRSERFKVQKEADIANLRQALNSPASDHDKRLTKKEYESAKKWLGLDQLEYQRLLNSRNEFLRQSLKNYLLSLAASDDFNADATRFLALWLAHADDFQASMVVSKQLPEVASRKFVSLMNQLSSRLQNKDDTFNQALFALVRRICEEHPYHGMFHAYAGNKIQGGHDAQGISRNAAAKRICESLSKSPRTSKIWAAIQRSNDLYMNLARMKAEELRQGARVPLRNFDHSRRVGRDVPSLGVPPITMSITLREDCDYTKVPTIYSFKPEMTISNGLSTPKVLTAITSDGQEYKQLFKSGSDDLRQDTIMEQVFDEACAILARNKATRLRKLRIRTYKVVPLDGTSGAIEFVQPTLPLMDFLSDAHQRYHPKDLKWKTAREKIAQVQEMDTTVKVKAFQDVKTRFSPVLRHFFFERFLDPDDWFARRLAYTRSTAAISILGHILGLGDRHCQNILLDTHTGEVVHIDLGVAFEAGRILPKPETVPFRLSPDIVDGFGMLKTEGVFRRCCEFTLEALRENKDIILTLLNVLRYDPLYSWSVSPLRARKLQDEQEATGVSVAPSVVSRRRSAHVPDGSGDAKKQNQEDRLSEADRALSVVNKKLSAALSATAAVNELIQQATDDRNLALLFHGKFPTRLIDSY